MPSVDIDIESISASSIIANAKWARLACQQRSVLGKEEIVRLTRQWLGRWRKMPPPSPTLSKILNNFETAAQSVVVFVLYTFSGVNLILSVKIWGWSVEFFFKLYRFLWRHYTPISVERCWMFGNPSKFVKFVKRKSILQIKTPNTSLTMF